MVVSAASSTVADGIAYDQVFDIIGKCDDSVEGITKYKSFTVSEINEYASKANQNFLETYIGKYYQDGVNSYDTIARTNGKNYFYLENYDEL